MRLFTDLSKQLLQCIQNDEFEQNCCQILIFWIIFEDSRDQKKTFYEIIKIFYVNFAKQ